MNKVYLGDSVYLEIDMESGDVILTTENGSPGDPSNRIVLEPKVYGNLLNEVKRIYDKE